MAGLCIYIFQTIGQCFIQLSNDLTVYFLHSTYYAVLFITIQIWSLGQKPITILKKIHNFVRQFWSYQNILLDSFRFSGPLRKGKNEYNLDWKSFLPWPDFSLAMVMAPPFSQVSHVSYHQTRKNILSKSQLTISISFMRGGAWPICQEDIRFIILSLNRYGFCGKA